ncbi:MAG: hypothetical protein ACTHN0_06230 [Aquihabitans sp.]
MAYLLGDVPDPSSLVIPDELRDRTLDFWADEAAVARLRAAWALPADRHARDRHARFDAFAADWSIAHGLGTGWPHSYRMREAGALGIDHRHAARLRCVEPRDR